MAFGGPAQSLNYRPASEDTYSPALPTATTPSADGLAQLQARRLALLEEAARQKSLRRSKEASICEAELRVVTHQILSTRTPHHA
jgi:hypothetical protein